MLNSVQIIGHLGRDPEVRYTAGGNAVAHLSVATSEKWADRNTGERREHTEWHRVTFFGRMAEVAGQYVRKGSLVFVAGQLRTNAWTDSDGVERYTTGIRGDTLRMLSRNDGTSRHRDDEAEAQERTGTSRQTSPVKHIPDRVTSFDYMTDDIPF